MTKQETDFEIIFMNEKDSLKFEVEFLRKENAILRKQLKEYRFYYSNNQKY